MTAESRAHARDSLSKVKRVQVNEMAEDGDDAFGRRDVWVKVR